MLDIDNEAFQEQIEDLMALLQAFRNGEIIEDHKE